MKIRNIFEMFGFKRKPVHYLYSVKECEVSGSEGLKFAEWNHPKHAKIVIDDSVVKGYSKYISDGDFCIDIGAHTGDTTLPIAVAAGRTGCVLALEPNPYVYPVLEKNVRQNAGLVNIITVMAAAASSEGFMEFEYSDPGYCNGGRHDNISSLRHGHFYKQTVFSINLADELRSDFSRYLPRLRFIKTDAEGYDLFVLQTLREIIREFRPVVKAEMFKQTDLEYRKQMLKFFVDINYTVFKIASDPLEEGEELSVANLEVGRHYDILAKPNSAR